VFATDSGNGTFLAAEHLRLPRPGCFIAPVDFSAMGYSVPAAIGACFANPGRDVVALAGDGALLMTGLELLTAATYGAAPLVVVLRDGRLNQIAQFQELPYNRTTCSVLPDYDVGGLCLATGSRYLRIIAEVELEPVLSQALETVRGRTPAVVEVAIDPAYSTHFTRGVLKTNFWRLPWGDRLRMLGRALARRVVG
jgi:acetolactate synthase I/II/III large subunit